MESQGEFLLFQTDLRGRSARNLWEGMFREIQMKVEFCNMLVAAVV